MSKPLTDDQIDSWRKILILWIGPAAMFLTKEQIQIARDRVQSFFLSPTEETHKGENPFCECDQKYHGATIHRDGSIICNHCQKPRKTLAAALSDKKETK